MLHYSADEGVPTTLTGLIQTLQTLEALQTTGLFRSAPDMCLGESVTIVCTCRPRSNSDQAPIGSKLSSVSGCMRSSREFEYHLYVYVLARASLSDVMRMHAISTISDLSSRMGQYSGGDAPCAASPDGSVPRPAAQSLTGRACPSLAPQAVVP